MNITPSSSFRRLLHSSTAVGFVLFQALLCSSCTEEKKEPAPAPPSEPAQVEKKPAPEPARVDPNVVGQFRREANVLFTQSDFDGAKEKVEAGLALAPDFSPLVRLKKRIERTLSNRCCGKWLRFDTTKPDSKKKGLRGVLYSENLGKNYRDHSFRARILTVCEEGKTSLRLMVPWKVPTTPTAEVSYTVGEEKGTEKVKPDVKKLAYELQGATGWFKKLGEHKNSQLKFQLPKEDGSIGEFVFELGESNKLMDELLAACP